MIYYIYIFVLAYIDTYLIEQCMDTLRIFQKTETNQGISAMNWLIIDQCAIFFSIIGDTSQTRSENFSYTMSSKYTIQVCINTDFEHFFRVLFYQTGDDISHAF